MKQTFLMILMLVSVMLTLTGCSGEPDQEWAEAAYKAQKPKIDAVFGGLETEFKRFAPVDYAALPDEDAKRELAQAQMAQRRTDFDKAAMKLLEGDPKIIGWEISYVFPEEGKPEIPFSFDELSQHVPSWKPGLVRAQRRALKKDDRLLGWGLFMIPGKETKTNVGLKALNYYKGLEVQQDIVHEGATLHVSLFIVPEPEG